MQRLTAYGMHVLAQGSSTSAAPSSRGRCRWSCGFSSTATTSKTQASVRPLYAPPITARTPLKRSRAHTPPSVNPHAHPVNTRWGPRSPLPVRRAPHERARPWRAPSPRACLRHPAHQLVHTARVPLRIHAGMVEPLIATHHRSSPLITAARAPLRIHAGVPHHSHITHHSSLITHTSLITHHSSPCVDSCATSGSSWALNSPARGLVRRRTQATHG